MRLFATLILLPILVACAGTDYELSYSSSRRDPNYSAVPQNPTISFSDTIASHNGQYTGMISNTEDQISRYITYRLNEFKNYNQNANKTVTDIDIARAALYLTDDAWRASDIEKRFAGNLTLMHMAVYVLDNRLNRCFTGDGASVATASACFVKWRDGNKTAFGKISEEIRLHTTELNVADAEFQSVDGEKITFIMDGGKITGVTIGSTNYRNFSKINVQSNDEFSMDKVDFNSVGKQVGLSYSDFGIYNITRTGYDADNQTQFKEIIANHMPFVGGYASQRIETDKIADDLHFNGRAVGNARDDTTLVYLDGDARLDFYSKNAQSTLTATFNGWYDIVVKNDGTITFDEYTGGNTIMFGDNDSYTKNGATMNIDFYGENPDSGIPSEATGIVQFHDTDTNIKMDIAFGVK